MSTDAIRNTLQSYFQMSAVRFDVDMAFLYGSWAAGRPTKDSDVDVAVLFSGEMEREQMFDRITTVSLELTRLLKREANVLALDADMSKPMLHYNAILHGSPVYIKDFSRYVELKQRALVQAEDFNIFGTKWQDEVVRRRLGAPRYA